MQEFTAKTFTVPALKGISTKTIEEHMKLYQGYVKNANLIQKKMNDYVKDIEGNQYAINELLRRLSFEFNGIRNHEVYFGALEGGPSQLGQSSPLRKKIEATWQSFDGWVGGMKQMAATMRGIGWAALVYDPADDRIHSIWIDEQHLNHYNGCTMILGIDMWEHSYVADYQPSGKKQYVEDYFANLNWAKVEENYKKARGR